MSITKFRSDLSLGLPDPDLTPPPLLSAAGEYFEVRVKYLHVLVRPGHPPPEVVPTQFLTRTIFAPRREFLALGPTSFRSVLASMGAAGIGDHMPCSLLDSLGPAMSRVSRSIAEDPTGLGAARVLTLRLYVVAETMTLQGAVAAVICRKVKAYVNGLEEVSITSDVGDHIDQCTVCLEEFGATLDDHDHDHGDDKVVRTPCCHVYHKACIVRWLRTSPSCPLCRYAMPIP